MSGLPFVNYSNLVPWLGMLEWIVTFNYHFTNALVDVELIDLCIAHF